MSLEHMCTGTKTEQQNQEHQSKIPDSTRQKNKNHIIHKYAG